MPGDLRPVGVGAENSLIGVPLIIACLIIASGIKNICVTLISGFGIASHLGVLSGIPCVGIAKTLMQVDGIAKDEQFTNKVSLIYI